VSAVLHDETMPRFIYFENPETSNVLVSNLSALGNFCFVCQLVV